jgi:hypothetical protein
MAFWPMQKCYFAQKLAWVIHGTTLKSKKPRSFHSGGLSRLQAEGSLIAVIFWFEGPFDLYANIFGLF